MKLNIFANELRVISITHTLPGFLAEFQNWLHQPEATSFIETGQAGG